MLPHRSVLVIGILTLSSYCYAGKNKANTKWIQEIDGVKSFKKLLRTKTNVMVMFANDENAATKSFDVYGECATEMKGTATLAWVDCSTKEGKKLCKKQKAAPSPVQLQHYKDGEFSSIYDRRYTVKSLKAFLLDPKSDGPWEEEDDAKDVVHIESEKQLNKLIKKNQPMLVMFYAPWCGFCKRFKPVFSEVATEKKGEVIMAGIDAQGNKDSASIREKYNITGFPKTIYFDEGKQKFEYSAGHTKQELIDWLNDPSEPKPKEAEVEWAESENDVHHLTAENFDSFIAENEKVMVFFYAPWCGHCKRLKPDWDLAATQLKEDEAPEMLAALDATKYKEIGDRFKVTGYPTIIYFENGEQKYDASSAFTRSKDGIIAYIKDAKPPPPPEKPWTEVESDVVHYDDATFKAGVKKKKHALIMFYAPWCGHCKKAKPEYQNAAAKFAEDKKVVFGAVDCTTSKDTCEVYDVKGYPTFYYLSYGKNPAKYQSGREEPDFVDFMSEKTGVAKTEL
uniref:Protein disulfide-isomerase A5 n=1 Tax=Phallusia mammillata TaxID=59560 RepID=A0A6F9DMS5_9ASCI|nr:protein disulfide-isomerase A5 [Phallusia mammillata]